MGGSETFCGSAKKYWGALHLFSAIHWQVLSTCMLVGCEACRRQWAARQSCCVASLADHCSGHRKFWECLLHVSLCRQRLPGECQASEVFPILCEFRSVFSSAKRSFATLCLRLETLQHWQNPVLFSCQHPCC